MIDKMESPVENNSEDSKTPEVSSIGKDAEFQKINILANSRRSYNSQDEFVCLIYNDILKVLSAKWHKIKSVKSVSVNEFRKKSAGDDHLPNKNQENENEEIFEKKCTDFGLGLSDWKLSSPDENVEVEFPNKNIYTGRLSRRQMEGSGIYRWRLGETYKGEFEENSIQGKGHIEWKDHSWYEGEFHKGHRHGKGNLVSHEYGRFYIGEWHMGRKHGNGYCRYGKDNGTNFYEGEWDMNERQGTGYRVYQNGTRYIGQWENGLRHGIGTMIWPNGDLYRGEWENGAMNGYGEYVWNGFLNKSLSWPQENSYMGKWQDGMRHGRGVLKLNSTGGAKYSGSWYMDKKHGHGMIIGNSGAVTQADPLFLNDILTPPDADTDYSENSCSEFTQRENEKELGKDENLSPDSTASKVPIKHREARKIKIFEPLQYPSLWFHIRRLLEPLKYTEKGSSETISSGKCHICSSQSSCKCLYDPSGKISLINAGGESSKKSSKTSTRISFDLSSCDNSYDQFCSHEEKTAEGIDVENTNVVSTEEKKYEEHWVHNCLTTHMSRLRKIYQIYAELYCPKKDVNPNLSMGKIALWQMMRDCGVHKRGISLVQIERYVALNKSAFIESQFYPFERIELFQFIQVLLEVSWHLYTKLDDIETEEMRGRLAGGLHRLLVRDIFPNAGNFIESLSIKYKDLLPIYSVYQLYCDIGEPHTAKELLRATCILKGTPDPKPLSFPKRKTLLNSRYKINGINAITVGERLSFIPSDESSLEASNFPDSSRTYEDHLARELFALRHLGAPKMVSIMAKICPGIKDQETDQIINMDYELTFLEFYEILLESTRTLIYMKKLSAQEEELEASNKLAVEKSATSFASAKSIKQSLKRSSSNISKIKKK